IENTLAYDPLEKRWHFTPRAAEGDLVEPGDIIGAVNESQTIEHRIMMPPNQRGRIVQIREGEFAVDEIAAIVKSEEG
ncbi:MAG TPA: hypothetical protein PLM89_12095, partial [Anaerolineales bacterium]|nr:hypothetical protein [Anaerolineales bacterium]